MINTSKKQIFPQILLLILLAIISLAIFVIIIYYSKDMVVNIWDESLYANNSLEMSKNSEWLNYYVRQHIDHHNTKPPLVIWFQVISYNLFSYNEFALRFPSYLALATTVLICIIFCKKVFGSYPIGFISGILILTSPSLIRRHVFLTGDLDATLVLFDIAFILYSYYTAYLKKAKYSTRTYVLYFCLIGAAWFTKSTSVLLIIPSSVLPFLFFKQIKAFFFNKKFGIGSLILVVTISIYYLIQEYQSPGYFQIVWTSEIWRVVDNPQKWLIYDRWFYFDELRFKYFTRYYRLILYLILPFFIFGEKSTKMKLGILLLIPITFLLIITIPESKMFWYSAPAFPLLCLVLAVLLVKNYELVLKVVPYRLSTALSYICLSVLLTGVFWQTKTLKNFLLSERADSNQLEYEIYALRQFEQKHKLPKKIKIYHPIEPGLIHHLDVLEFYKLIYQYNQKHSISINEKLKKDDWVITQGNFMDSLSQQYHFQIIDSNKFGKLVVVQ